jgi:hypothetical protein
MGGTKSETHYDVMSLPDEERRAFMRAFLAKLDQEEREWIEEDNQRLFDSLRAKLRRQAMEKGSKK